MRGIGECDQRGVDGVVVGVGWSGVDERGVDD